MAITVMVALAGVVLEIVTGVPLSLPLAFKVLVGIVLIKLPIVVDVTLISTKHSPGVAPTWAGTDPPLKDKVVVFGAAVAEPPQVLFKPFGFAIFRPACTPIKLSVQLVFVNGNVFGLNTVTLSTEIPPALINIGVNCLLISAGMAIA